MSFEINDKIVISKITTFNYIRNNEGVIIEELIEYYVYLYSLLGHYSNEDKKIIEKQTRQNVDMLKELDLITEKEGKISINH